MNLSKKIEVHYYFSDNSHSMNALVKNKCEAEFLAVAIELASILEIPFELDSEALKKGGIKEVWKAIGDNSTQIAFVISVLALISSTIPRTDQELIDLQKEDVKLSIEERKLKLKNIKLEIEKNKLSGESIKDAAEIASNNYKIATRKSNFYKILANYEKVSKLGFTELNIDDKALTEEKVVLRKDFQNFVLKSNQLESLTNSNAHIEIVAPVLKEGKAKWKGLYENNPISFAMDDKDFKNDIISKKLSFKNGDEIICVLLIHKKVDELGEIVTSGYSVEVVLENIHSGSSSKTNQGKRYSYNKKMHDRQSDMFKK